MLTDENGNILVDENGNKLLAEIGITDTEVFQNLTQAYMPKNEKIIKDIIIQIDDDITVEQLSEGEKKLILVKTVLEILSDEKTLVLMDEPDAHLHEGRKPALCNMMREYPNRQIVIATHSPIMAQIANEKELLMLELENGKSTILTDEKIEKIKKLSGTSWDVIGQGMMLRSSRPLVVFEGKTDVMYVKRALEMLKSRVTDYASLNVDFLNANGAGNVKSFIDNLKSFVPDSKKIVVFFDRDNAGKDGVQAITGISKNDERVAHYQDTVHGVCRSLLCRVVEVCIDVCRGGEGTVTQPDLDLLHGDTVAEKQAGAGVTKIMEANLAKPVLLDEPREMLRYIVRA